MPEEEKRKEIVLEVVDWHDSYECGAYVCGAQEALEAAGFVVLNCQWLSTDRYHIVYQLAPEEKKPQEEKPKEEGEQKNG